MDKDALQAYLHQHIPLSAAMQVAVQQADEGRVILTAPLAPNINHQGTAFGGSIATLATLAGWSLMRLRLAPCATLPHLVVQRSSIDYLQPITERFSAHARYPAEADWPAFLARLACKGRARQALDIDIFAQGTCAARMEALFVALC